MFSKHFGTSRFVYNWGLDKKIKAYQTENKKLSCFDLSNLLTSELKQKHAWLREANSQSLQMALRNLDNAFTRFFRKNSKFPNFKKKIGKQSFQCPQYCTVDFKNGLLSIPKTKGIKTVFHRTFEGKIKTITISKTTTKKYFASILVEDGKELPVKIKPVKEKSIGVDLGIKHFATLSSGEKVGNPRLLNRFQKRLARASKKLSNKQKGSKNRAKYKLKLAILHEKISNKRSDFIHKLSGRLIDENQAVCLEDLNVSGMMKNHKLARAISDVSWRSFRTFCEYKADWYGKNVKIIGRFEPSSKLCDRCGTVNKSLTLKDRTWTCSCGAVHDRDILAAKNILNFAFYKSTEGTSEIQACGDHVRPSQEGSGH